MPDARENVAGVRIYAETLESMQDEQLRRRRSGASKPSIADLVKEAWDLQSLQWDGGERPVIAEPVLSSTGIEQLPPEQQALVEKAAAVFQAGGENAQMLKGVLGLISLPYEEELTQKRSKKR